MTQTTPEPEEWPRLLSAAKHLQSILPDAILVGGSAAVLHAGHRLSLDADHVLNHLREHFDEVLQRLEREPEWRTERMRKPVMILGELDGVLTGVRQLRRTSALELDVIAGIRVPSLPEMARIKAFMLVSRATTRDYLDTVVLMERLGDERVRAAFSRFDEIYERGPDGGLPLVELVDRLGAAWTWDRTAVELRTYKRLAPPWNDWDKLSERGRVWATCLGPLAVGPDA